MSNEMNADYCYQKLLNGETGEEEHATTSRGNLVSK